MDTIDAIHTRRSIRAYTSRPVERDRIETLIWDAAQAPPPFSCQNPWTFNVIQGVDRNAALGARVKAHALANRPNESDPIWLERPGVEVFWGAPALVVISGEAGDCCRAAQNLMLSAHARGLGTCWVGSPMPWLRTDQAKADLHIPTTLTPVVAMCLGYPETIPNVAVRERPPIIWVA